MDFIAGPLNANSGERYTVCIVEWQKECAQARLHELLQHAPSLPQAPSLQLVRALRSPGLAVVR